jgi:hypothetical protein
VFTYDHVAEVASNIVSLMKKAHEREVPTSAEKLANSGLQLTGFARS